MKTSKDTRCKKCDHTTRDHHTEFSGVYVTVICDRDCSCHEFIDIEDMLTF